VASSGQHIELAAGVYGAQRLTPDASKPAVGERIVFRPASGAQVSVGATTFEMGVRHVELRSLHFSEGWEAGPGDSGPFTEDLFFRDTSGTLFTIMNVSQLTVQGGTYGPAVDERCQIKIWNLTNTYRPTDVVIEDVRFEGFTRVIPTSGAGCLQIYAGERVTLRRNRFKGCGGEGAILMGTLGAAGTREVSIENNWFGSEGDSLFNVQLDTCVPGTVFRYNSLTKPLAINACTGSGSLSVKANVMPWSASTCDTTAASTYSFNVLTGGTCGTSDRQVTSLGYRDPATFDLHLEATSPALGAGDPASFPAVDIDGEARGQNGAPEAGADELP
jgi:hypothetical protein